MTMISQASQEKTDLPVRMLSGTEVSQALGQEGVIFDTVRMSMKKKKKLLAVTPAMKY